MVSKEEEEEKVSEQDCKQITVGKSSASVNHPNQAPPIGSKPFLPVSISVLSSISHSHLSGNIASICFTGGEGARKASQQRRNRHSCIFSFTRIRA